MPTGKVKWYASEKGFGFIETDEGEDVYVPSSALPAGVTTLKNGARVEFGVAEGKRGKQALAIKLLEPRASVVKGTRKSADSMAVLIEDVIKLLDGVSNDLRRGRYPNDSHASKVAAVLRAIADDIDV